MVKNYLNKSLYLVLLLLTCLFCHQLVNAAESYSNLFIKITDATTAVQQDDQDKAKELVAEIRTEFETKENHDSQAGKAVSESLNITGEVTEEKLSKISEALIGFEKEQNPVDFDAEKEKLVNRLQPKFDDLQTAISSKKLEDTRQAYKKLNSTWTLNERVVRDSSTAHYGKIETALSFLRGAIETEPADFDSIQTSFDDLKTAIDQFVSGEKVESASTGDLTLKDGVKLLETALEQFKKGDKQKASASMKQFITIWPSIEGDVSTRNAALYTRVESETPVIMVKGVEKAYQDKLQALITDLSQIDTSASYNFFDAMLILLREGVEALLIIMALVSTLKASKMKKGLKWVYAGAVIGILASAIIALILQSTASSALASSSNREIIEGAVGIFAVFMMLLIGIWLHSKSSVKKWNQFMEKQMKVVVGTGSFVSMFSLSFLAVFREGAETILFYVGILPRITMEQFLLGIALAILVLIILAFLMAKATNLIQPHRIFFWLTWLIYALAFKMLGVSIHALQLTNILPSHLLNGFPTIDWAGIYPSLEVVSAQAIFLALILFVTLKNREHQQNG